MQAQLVSDLCRVHGVREVLLVGEHQQHGVTELVLSQHSVKLVPGLSYPLPVVTVHHKDQPLGILQYNYSSVVVQISPESCVYFCQNYSK